MPPGLVLRGETLTTRDQSTPLPGGRRTVIRRTTLTDRSGRTTSVGPPRIVGGERNVRGTPPVSILPPRTDPGGGGGGLPPLRPGGPGGPGGPELPPSPPSGYPGIIRPQADPPGGGPVITGFQPGLPGLPGGGGGYIPGQGGWQGVGSAACGLVPEGVARDLCLAAAGFLPGTGGAVGGDEGNNLVPSQSCPPGFQKNNQGQCVRSGVGGMLERTLPGGDTGYLADSSGQAVVDQFGNPALVPTQVGTIARQDGSVGPILRCPGGMVLGRNDLCYVKGTLPKAFRKWKPAPKPPMTAQDAKVLRRADALKKRVKKLAGKAGYSCKKR